MKSSIKMFTLAVLLAVLALATPAQESSSSPQAPSGKCTEEFKQQTYNRFTSNLKTNQQVAYEAGKEYLSCFGNENDQYVNYIRRFVTAYEQATQKAELRTRFQQLYQQQKYAEAFPLGKQILAEEPDNLSVLIATAWSGLGAVTAGQDAIIPDAASIARKTLQEIEAGKTPQGANNFNKDETIGWLNYALGIYAVKQNNPREALNYLYKAAQYEGFAKKDPQTYALLALAYQQAYYEPMAKEYRDKYQGQPESPEQQAALAQLNQVIDRIIDAYARAIAYANASGDARYQQRKVEWTNQLTAFYKFRNNDSTTGMDQLIASVTTKPLPSPAIPAPAPTPTPISQPSSGGTTGASPAAANPAAQQTVPASASPKPQSSPIKQPMMRKMASNRS